MKVKKAVSGGLLPRRVPSEEHHVTRPALLRLLLSWLSYVLVHPHTPHTGSVVLGVERLPSLLQEPYLLAVVLDRPPKPF